MNKNLNFKFFLKGWTSLVAVQLYILNLCRKPLFTPSLMAKMNVMSFIIGLRIVYFG